MRAVGIIFSNIHDNNVPELARIRTLGSIPFGGRYRLIDFPLSNMVNSGIDTVGIITKSNYQSLMDHVGSGKDWDLARKDGGLIFLPPYGDLGNDSLYTSRLEALKGITSFLFRADEEYVVMSDCDNVCRINFNDVIENHIRSHADVSLVYKKIKRSELPIEANVIDFDMEKDRVVGVNYLNDSSKENLNVFINVFVLKKSLLQNIVMDSISRNKRHFMTDVIAENLKSMKIIGYEHEGFYTGITSLKAYFDGNMSLLNEANRKATKKKLTCSQSSETKFTRSFVKPITFDTVSSDGLVLSVESLVSRRGMNCSASSSLLRSWRYWWLNHLPFS